MAGLDEMIRFPLIVVMVYYLRLKIDDTSFKLYEYVQSPNNNISQDNPNTINRCKDGWTIIAEKLIRTLILYASSEADTYAVKLAIRI